MTSKSLILGLALALSTSAFAKSYNLSFDKPVTVGTTQLAAGDYKFELDGAKATFTDSRTRKATTVDAKVSNMDTKFDQTATEFTEQNGVKRIEVIRLGGSNTQIEFAK